MAVTLFTGNADVLLAKIQRLIDEGHVSTWAYTGGGDFTHTAAGGQWKNKAWLRPKLLGDRLTMNIVRPNGGAVSREVYAIYHGRFPEMAIAHVPELFTIASATPFAVDGDLV
jgi:hypothetical protein